MDKKLIIALIAGLAVSLPASAKLYKWVDEKGVTHYGETIPPEYANKDRAELNKAGRLVNQKDILTPEERAAKEQEAAQKRAELEAAKEQKRRDKALLNTYSNSQEIELARKRNLQQIEARVSSTSSQLKKLEGSLAELKKEAAGYTKTDKKIPPSLQDDLKETQARRDRLQQDLEKYQAEKAVIEARFDADKVRYKELTGR